MSGFGIMRHGLVAFGVLLAYAAGAEPVGPYRVAPGDRLEISTFGQPELSGTIRVRESGEIALHMVGRVPVAGLTLSEVEDVIAEKVGSAFQAEPSVVVEVEEYRDVYVLGAVGEPGAYPWRPGMTVLKAVAIAGGLGEGQRLEDEDDERRLAEAQRRALQARTQIETLAKRIEALSSELARLEGEAGPGEIEGEHAELVELRRTVHDESLRREERRREIAGSEVESIAERREIIARQLAATEDRLEDMQGLVDRGLARRDSLLELQIDVDNYRADALEAAAFEARARQTAANAEGEIAVTRARHHQDLLQDRLAAIEDLEIARVDLASATDEMRRLGGPGAIAALGEETRQIFGLRRDGEGERVVDADAALQPDDVLTVRVELVETPTL